MYFRKLKSGIYDWIKSPLGLSVLLVAVVYQGLNWPAILYIENEYEKLEWVEVDTAEFSKAGGRYGNYRLRVTGINGEKIVFSTFGFLEGESAELANTLKKYDRIGWYTTCLPWKSGRVEDLILSSNCAVIMEVSREGKKYISFKERFDFLEREYFQILFRIYTSFTIFALISVGALVFHCRRRLQ
ncbi:MAG: hypothetical protein ACRBB4_11870 [Neptuniibacter sp.]